MRAARGILVSALLLLAIPVWAQDQPTYQSLWATATQKPECMPADYADFTLVTCREELTLWYFTKPNHPAHPGVIKRTIVQENGVWHGREHGYSFASNDAQPAFKRWLAEIADLDRQMKEDIERRRRAGAGPTAD